MLSGALGALDRVVAGWRLPGYATGLAYFLLISAFFTLVSLPASVYLQFVIEQRFGFNKMTPRLFLVRLSRNLVISAALLTPVLLALFWFVDRTGPLWWLLGFAGVSLFQLVVTVIYPTLIAPLFNKFTAAGRGQPQGAHPRPRREARLRDEGDLCHGRQQALSAQQRLLHGPGQGQAHRALRHV